MGYIGSIPADKFQTLQKQSFTTSATDTYTLSYAVTNPQDLALFINNVRQNPNDAYTVSGTTLTLSSAITGSDTMYAVFLGKSVETIAPAVGSVTLGMLSASGTKDSSTFLRGDNTFASAGGIFESQLLHVRDEKSSGTSGGTASTGYNTRALNTVKTNEITGASLSSNQITLPTGTYYVIASAPSRRSNNHRIRLRNTTDSSDTLLGSSTRSGDGDATTTASIMSGRFTISAQKVFEIQHWFGANGSGTDVNIQGSNVNSGENEVYTDVQIWKVA